MKVAEDRSRVYSGMQDRGVSPNEERLPLRTSDRDPKASVLGRERKSIPDRNSILESLQTGENKDWKESVYSWRRKNIGERSKQRWVHV